MTDEYRNHKLSPDDNDKISHAHLVLPENPVRIIELTRTFGLDVRTASFKPGYAGAITKDSDTEKYTVYLNEQDSKPRQRFTCAHELAHYLLHRDDIGDGFNENTLFRSHLSNEKEIEANKIAADILMPMLVVNEMAKDNDIASLATTFGVSRSAVLVRLGIPG